MNTRIPTRAFLAWVDKGILPYGGGVLEQPFPLWRIMETMYEGYLVEKRGRQAQRDAVQAAMLAAMRGG